MTAIVSLRRLMAAPPLLRPPRREGLALCLVLLVVIVIAVALSCGIVDYDGELDGVVLLLVALWLCGNVADAWGAPHAGNVFKIMSVVALSDVTIPLASAALATRSFPLADRHFLMADRMILGTDVWPGIISTFAFHPVVLKALSYAYVSIGWQPLALVVALCISGKLNTAWRFATAWVASLLICLIVFPWCPGVGAYAYFNISPADVPEVLVRSAWHYPVTLQSFREGSVHRLGFSALDGIIAMPSFHACASVLLAWGFGHLRRLSIVFAALNAAMWASSVPIGGHYVVDVLAGSIVALVGIRVSALAISSNARQDERPGLSALDVT